MSTQIAKARSHLATLSRRAVKASSDQIEDARRELANAKILDYVEKVLAAAPPLTASQRDRIASLLRAGGGAGPPTPAPQPASGGSTAPSKNRQAVVAERITELDGGAL